MSITFSLPQTIESQLRSKIDDLDQLAKEAAVVEFYRQGKLSHGELAEKPGRLARPGECGPATARRR